MTREHCAARDSPCLFSEVVEAVEVAVHREAPGRRIGSRIDLVDVALRRVWALAEVEALAHRRSPESDRREGGPRHLVRRRWLTELEAPQLVCGHVPEAKVDRLDSRREMVGIEHLGEGEAASLRRGVELRDRLDAAGE